MIYYKGAAGHFCPTCGHGNQPAGRGKMMLMAFESADYPSQLTCLVCDLCGAGLGCHPHNPGHELCRVRGWCVFPPGCFLHLTTLRELALHQLPPEVAHGEL